MNSTTIEIKIPAVIAALPGLSLVERIVLDHIDRFPGCSNGRLAKLTGLSVRGIEAMLVRLRKHGYIRRIGQGRARQHKLLVHVDRHIDCGKKQSENSPTDCGVEQNNLPVVTTMPSKEADEACDQLMSYPWWAEVKNPKPISMIEGRYRRFSKNSHSLMVASGRFRTLSRERLF